MELKLTPNVLFCAIGAVAGAIGPKCEAKMMHAAIAASTEEGNAVPANVDLRDYFAAQAVNAIINMNYPMSDIGYSMRDGKNIIENYALCAYQLADAMLAARDAA